MATEAASVTRISDKKLTPIDVAFPVISPDVVPFGSRVLVQIRVPKTMTAGGLVLPEVVRATENDNTTVARVVSCGPLAFKNREKMSPWPEGAWVEPGDYVQVPRYGGHRWQAPHPLVPEDKVELAIVEDLNLISKVTGDPLKIKAFI